MACIVLQRAASNAAGGGVGDGAVGGDGGENAVLAHALMYAHCWMLHTIGDLEHRKYIDKQAWFW